MIKIKAEDLLKFEEGILVICVDAKEEKTGQDDYKEVNCQENAEGEVPLPPPSEENINAEEDNSKIESRLEIWEKGDENKKEDEEYLEEDLVGDFLEARPQNDIPDIRVIQMSPSLFQIML